MSSRRHFLAGSAALLAASAAGLSRTVSAEAEAKAKFMQGYAPDTLLANPENSRRYRPPYRLGMGGAPMSHADVGRMCEPVAATWSDAYRYCFYSQYFFRQC